MKHLLRARSVALALLIGGVGVALPTASLAAQPTAHVAKNHHHARHHRRARHPGRGIPQHNGGDADFDNNGGPSDGDGGL